jgi:excisionase family DNA binding protein
MPPSHVTVQQVADDLQVHERTVQRWIADGTLKALRVGPTLLRINVEDLEAFLSGERATRAQHGAAIGAARPQSGEHRA